MNSKRPRLMNNIVMTRLRVNIVNLAPPHLQVLQPGQASWSMEIILCLWVTSLANVSRILCRTMYD